MKIGPKEIDHLRKVVEEMVYLSAKAHKPKGQKTVDRNDALYKHKNWRDDALAVVEELESRLHV